MECINPDIDVFVGNYTYIDFDAYQLWLAQTNAHEAADKLALTETSAAQVAHLYTYVLDQYRVFGMLEPMLQFPLRLSHQLLFQISPDVQQRLLLSYYEIDMVVIREILGKKLSKSTRRDLDEISFKTNTPLKCCQRQFDNCRRMFKALEDAQGNLIENILKIFLLTKELSQKYATVVFLAINRFECTKRRMSHLTFDDFVECSRFLMEDWSFKQGDFGVELDADFLYELRSIKVLISDQKLCEQHRQLTIQELKQKGVDEVVDVTARQVFKTLVVIGSSLYKVKDLRDFFNDLVEKVTDVCRGAGWSRDRLQQLLAAHAVTVQQLQPPQQPQFAHAWCKYTRTLAKCLLQIYHT